MLISRGQISGLTHGSTCTSSIRFAIEVYSSGTCREVWKQKPVGAENTWYPDEIDGALFRDRFLERILLEDFGF